ncbi:MAG: hypothetical protein M1495_09750 [Bacteroidetes bacterium]|nr:hypothetical protein [Bacteroidota bacterium]MCL6099690.1 hypothetical protein [Bacteroidota bacterium]
MKKTLSIAIVLFAAALFGFNSKAQAQSITDNDLLEVASGLNVDVQHSDLGQADVETAAEVNGKTTIDKVNSAGLTKSSVMGITTDGPEGVGEGLAEGPDLDGPGGSTHQFNGEETGNH